MRYLLITILCLVSTFGIAQSYTVNQGQAISESMSHVPSIISIPVSGLPNVIDQSFGLASVCLNITHPELNNLTIKLVAPDGTKVTLFHQLGYTDDNLINTCFDDQGPPVYFQSAPFTGTYRSTLPLGQVNNGQNPNGTWSLWIYDDWLNAGSNGYFQDVTLNFNNMPAAPFSFQQSNLPIIEINTQDQVINNYTKALVEFKTFDQQSGVNDFLLDAPKYNAKALIEWQGWSSPGFPKKNFDIDLVDASGVRIDDSLLGMPAENDWVLKGEFVDRTLVKNSLVFDLYQKMGHYAPRTRFCEVVLDGEYVGVYTLQEKVKRNDERVKIDALTPGELSYPNISGGYIFEMNPSGAPPDWYSMYAAGFGFGSVSRFNTWISRFHGCLFFCRFYVAQ
jgi:subtilisin-like proprotein convertase family protein